MAAGSIDRHEACVGENDHHPVCRVCGAIIDVSRVIGELPRAWPTGRPDLAIEEPTVTSPDLCPTRQTTSYSDKKGSAL